MSAEEINSALGTDLEEIEEALIELVMDEKVQEVGEETMLLSMKSM
jgi:hypothetical protein